MAGHHGHNGTKPPLGLPGIPGHGGPPAHGGGPKHEDDPCERRLKKHHHKKHHHKKHQHCH
jgi:hypothetical protein